MNAADPRSALSGIRQRLRQLGPGLITGGADHDPSGIATYSQAGAQFGYSMLWTVAFTLPLINIAADIAAMAEALRLLLGGSAHVYAVTFGLLGLMMQVFLRYKTTCAGSSG